jgi:hypothetical protein
MILIWKLNLQFYLWLELAFVKGLYFKASLKFSLRLNYNKLFLCVYLIFWLNSIWNCSKQSHLTYKLFARVFEKKINFFLYFYLCGLNNFIKNGQKKAHLNFK